MNVMGIRLTTAHVVVNCFRQMTMSNQSSYAGWFFNGTEFSTEPPDGSVGFIYMITRLDSGRKYIGKKLLKFSRTKTIAGKKKKMTVDSDWKTYYG